MSDNLEIDRLAEEARNAAREHASTILADAGIDRCCATWDALVFAIEKLATLARTPSGMAEALISHSETISAPGAAIKVDVIHLTEAGKKCPTWQSTPLQEAE